ncbi:hypothetical protein HK100_011681 [Physocladia obscura]|uniref:DUF2428 domain-containing protein n=1 Tax=Physocladia obscura TaxID=109957 RepID=A0AAD5XGG0_9FUNG|nr:hypothetical protein HK100_011681 [Physocladia obscura]
MSMKGEVPGFGDDEIQGLLEQAVKMLYSVKASDADGGASIFRLVFAKYVNSASKKRFKLSEDFENINATFEPSAAFVVQLLSLLRRHVSIAESDLASSINEYPMHGLFAAVRAVLQEINFTSIQEIETWATILQDTFDLIHRATKSVLIVLSSESPEGNYPGLEEGAGTGGEDMVDGGDGINFDAVVADGGGEKTSKSQRILHECFRTVKEACGALEVVLCRPPLPVAGKKELISIDLIISGGDWLRMLLTTIRHHGAFSGVYTCFQTLCETLLCSKQQQFVEKPQLWLADFVQKAKTMDVSITRRSGGLPLGVLAVIASPLSPFRAGMLAHTMDQLFVIGKADVPVDANTNLDLPQVHAFNIIRRLLQDSSITDLMRNYFADCFVLSIDGLSSKSFPIRNCATMLFSALVTKVIGVKKSRDEDSMLNTVTGREFFSRFPTLHSFMMAKLSSAVAELHDEHHSIHPAFYPILTILARLKPSPIEGNDSHLTLSSFRPLVHECASASVFKVREVAARAYAALIPLTSLVSALINLLQEISVSHDRNENNTVHGLLLIVRQLVQVNIIPLETFDWIFVPVRVPPAIQDVFFNIVRDVFALAQRDLLKKLDNAREIAALQRQVSRTLHVLRASAVRLFFQTNTLSTKTKQPWTFNLRQNLATLILDSLTGEFHCGTALQQTEIILLFLNDVDYEVQVQTLSFLRKHLQYSEFDFKYLDWSRIVAKLISLVHGRSTYEQVTYLAAEVCVFEVARPHMANCGLYIFEDLCERLSVTLNTYEVEAILPFLAVVAIENTLSDKINVISFDVLVGLMKKWSLDDTSVYVRASVIRALELLLPYFGFGRVNNEEIYVEMLFLLETLLDDDDSDVRAAASNIAARHLNMQEMIPLQCRVLLISHILQHTQTKTGLSKVSQYALSIIFGTLNTETVLESQINPTHVLFAQEDGNQSKEECVDAILAYRILDYLYINGKYIDFESRILEWCNDSISAFESKQIYLNALQGKGKFFGLSVRLGIALLLVKQYSKSGLLDGLVARFLMLPLHQESLQIVQDNGHEQKTRTLMALFPELQ